MSINNPSHLDLLNLWLTLHFKNKTCIIICNDNTHNPSKYDLFYEDHLVFVPGSAYDIIYIPRNNVIKARATRKKIPKSIKTHLWYKTAFIDYEN
jgi:hypothetical protein